MTFHRTCHVCGNLVPIRKSGELFFHRTVLNPKGCPGGPETPGGTVTYWQEGNPVAPALTPRLIRQQEAWSRETFGPGRRTGGIIDHIRKELEEVSEDPFNTEEWIDILILAIDGAWRHGATPVEIIETYKMKLQENMERTWPDWRTGDEDHAIEHDRTAVPRPPVQADPSKMVEVHKDGPR